MPNDTPLHHSEARALPQPFMDEPWRGKQKDAAVAFWQWHLSLMRPMVPPGTDAAAFAAEEQVRVEEGRAVTIVPQPVGRSAYEQCAEHGLSRSLLAEQIRCAVRFAEPMRFEDGADLSGFVSGWAVPHARLLGGLADADHTWQLRYVDELAIGFFMTGRIMNLPQDVARERLFIPVADLEAAGVDLEQLRRGEVTEPLRRLLWKQLVRIRDAFAQGMPLASELDRPFGIALRRAILGSLELLSVVERRKFDVWSAPIRLSWHQQLTIRYQARFGRGTLLSPRGVFK